MLLVVILVVSPCLWRFFDSFAAQDGRSSHEIFQIVNGSAPLLSQLLCEHVNGDGSEIRGNALLESLLTLECWPLYVQHCGGRLVFNITYSA